MLNFINDNQVRLLLEIEQNGMLAIIYSIHVKEYVDTAEILKLEFLAIKISFSYYFLASSDLKSFLNSLQPEVTFL